MNQTSACPEAILASIPWYPAGLTPDECGAVEAHAADCRECRAELAFLRGDDEPEIELPNAEQVYARVLARIAAPSEEESFPTVRRLSRRAAKPVSVAAGMLVALISGMLATGTIWVVRVVPTYETAAGSPAIAAAAGPQFDVVFRSDATASEIQTGLRDAHASVVSGPNRDGVYRLRLAPGSDIAGALERLRAKGRGIAASAEPARI